MKKTVFTIALGMILAACATTSSTSMSGPPEVMAKDVSSLPPELQAIAGYTYGDSRAGLLKVEAMVRETPSPGLAASLANLLHTGATPDAKQFACRQLAIIATEAEVKPIAALLYDTSTADMARYALQPLEFASVDNALLTALDHAPAETHIGIINSLGARGSTAAIPKLRELTTGINPATAEAATAALARIEG